MDVQTKDGAIEMQEIHRSKTLDSDDAVLARLGKKPVLKVVLAFQNNFIR